MREKVYFITDLDRTIIHAKNKGFKCVESDNEKEITYMTRNSYYKFLEILKNKNLIFIPCTMRNKKQTLRIDFIKNYNPDYMICTNGAQIYNKGILDETWEAKIRELIKKKDIKKQIDYIKGLDIRCQEIRNIEDFYITIKCLDKEDANFTYNVLKDKFEASIKIMKIGVKIFIINKNINKIYAVDYLINKVGIKKLVTSGDSEADKEFTTRGKAILPKHASFSHENACITKQEGIYATECIIDYLNEEFIHYNLIK
ncbi:MAG: HAD family hydrolase [Sarcina sp.]